MTLYEINSKLAEIIDESTGEIIDFEAFESLMMAKEEKSENIALAIKNITAEASAIASEIKALTERKKAAENKVSRLKEYLSYILAGEKLKTGKVSVSYRKSSAVEVDESFREWAENNGLDNLLTYKDPEPSKTAIKEWLADGNECPSARIVERESLIIK